jgi:chemotaxis protein MotA
MLQNMSDPSAIGPALAVSFLTLFYGVILHMTIAVPVSQHHLRMAGSDASEFNPVGPGLRLLGVLGIATGIAFFVMLLAMANF